MSAPLASHPHVGSGRQQRETNEPLTQIGNGSLGPYRLAISARLGSTRWQQLQPRRSPTVGKVEAPAPVRVGSVEIRPLIGNHTVATDELQDGQERVSLCYAGQDRLLSR